MRLAHEGHQGIVKMKARLRMKVWWPKIDSDAEQVRKSCHGCQVVGEFWVPEPMKGVKPPTGPWQDIAIDLMGPLPTGESLLVVVDYYSRFYEVAIMCSTAAKRVVDVLTQMDFHLHSSLTMVLSFAVRSLRSFSLITESIEHLTSPPLWSQANGHVERQNRTLLKTLKVAHI